MPIYNIKLSWNVALEGYVGKDKINMNTREETWIEKKKVYITLTVVIDKECISNHSRVTKHSASAYSLAWMKRNKHCVLWCNWQYHEFVCVWVWVMNANSSALYIFEKQHAIFEWLVLKMTRCKQADLLANSHTECTALKY